MDVSITFDIHVSLEKAYELKFMKYCDICKVLPFVIGTLSSWHPIMK